MFKIQEKTKLVKINNKDVEAHVTIEWDYDDMAPDFDYGNEEENAKELARFESGELLNLVLRVRTSVEGIMGESYLGSVFVTSKGMVAELLGVAEFNDMETEALNEMKVSIVNQFKALSQILG